MISTIATILSNNKASRLGIYNPLTNRNVLSLFFLSTFSLLKIFFLVKSVCPHIPSVQTTPRSELLRTSVMASPDRGRPLPKFGEWDVNNPASAEGFTVIFNKARDEKKTKTAAVVKIATPRKNDVAVKKVHDNSKKKWFCCGA